MTSDVDGNYRGVYTYGAGDERISVEDLGEIEGQPNNPLYYLHDALGSTSAITNMNAEVIDSNRFGPYGEPLDPVAKNARLTNSPFGYTGEAHDIEARLVYLRARYYEPGTMQFLQQDTVLGNIQDPLSRNLYAYGQGNPVNYTDPSGHMIVVDDVNNVYYNHHTDKIIFNNGEIQFGDKGKKVSEIQTMFNSLKSSRYNVGKVDGDFGNKTLKAVNNFKNDYRINNTGIWEGVVDQKTRSTLVTASKQMFEDGSGVFVDAKKDTEQVKSPPVEEKSYLGRSAEQLFYGNYTDEVTLLGTSGQVTLGLLGADLPMDIRDISADFVHWQWTWGHAGKTAIDIIGAIPVIGAVKYADEVGTLVKAGVKNIDKVDEGLSVVKTVDNSENLFQIDLQLFASKGTRNGKPYSKGRPSYGKGQVDEVWESAKQVDGKVYDPNTGEELFWDKTKSRNGQWDMGHTPENKYSEWHKKYMDGEITLDEFKEWYRNSDHYVPESPYANRSHRYE